MNDNEPNETGTGNGRIRAPATPPPTYPVGYVQRFDPSVGAWIWVPKQ